MQCKDIPDGPILRRLVELDRPATMFDGFPHSIDVAMGPEIPPKLARAKMASLVRRGLVEGCACGCRGDFRITDRGTGELMLMASRSDTPPSPAPPPA